MKLETEVTINISGQEKVISDLEVVIIDDCQRKIAFVRMAPFFRPMILWAREDYDAIGDYTQRQVEERILYLLGYNPQEKLQSLIG